MFRQYSIFNIYNSALASFAQNLFKLFFFYPVDMVMENRVYNVGLDHRANIENYNLSQLLFSADVLPMLV